MALADRPDEHVPPVGERVPVVKRAPIFPLRRHYERRMPVFPPLACVEDVPVGHLEPPCDLRLGEQPVPSQRFRPGTFGPVHPPPDGEPAGGLPVEA